MASASPEKRPYHNKKKLDIFSCGTWVKGSGCASGIRHPARSKFNHGIIFKRFGISKATAVSAIGSFSLLLFPTVGDDTGYGKGITRVGTPGRGRNGACGL